MSQEMLRIIDAIARDRNVDKESLFRDIEQAMVSAARKHFNAEDTEEFSATVDRITGQIQIFHQGDEIPMSKLGRIPAQTAKQVMIQKFREDERASIYQEFSQRVGDLATGTAQRYEGGALVVQIGRAEGFMPRSEQIPGEQHMPGERVRCLILDVRDEGHQVKIVLSRAHVDCIRRLFEVEVPEVAERIIEIKSIAREPGHRTKIAVSSIDSKVDAVGACVGVRGSRIKNIVDELGGEKIDVVRWNESSQVLIANALRPAEIVEISLCFELGRATVVVNEDQLSLAIGKRGQNVRLAARLTGWDIDILTPAEFARGLDILEETLQPIEGVTEEMIDRMAALGLISVFDAEEVGADLLMQHFEDFGMTPELAQRIVQVCGEKAKVVAEQQAREREEAERRKAADAAAQAAAPGEERAAAILGGAAGRPAAPDRGSGQSSDIMEMLLSRGAGAAGAQQQAGERPSDEEAAAPGEGEPAEAAATEEAGSADSAEETEEGEDRPHDVALAQERHEQQDEREQTEGGGARPTEREAEQAQDQTEVARLAQGEEIEEDTVEHELTDQRRAPHGQPDPETQPGGAERA